MICASDTLSLQIPLIVELTNYAFPQQGIILLYTCTNIAAVEEKSDSRYRPSQSHSFYFFVIVKCIPNKNKSGDH